MMDRRRALLVCMGLATASIAAGAAAERVALSVHGSWGAFRDGARCYAVSEPAEPARTGDARPFLAIQQAPARV